MSDLDDLPARAVQETKAQKIERMREELRKYRVETLQDAARILQQLDLHLLSPEALERRDKVIALLNGVAEVIRKAS